MYTMSFCLPCGQCSCLPLAEAPADYLSARTPTDFSEPLQSRDRLCWRYRNGDRSRLGSVATGTMYSVAKIKFIGRAIFAFLPSFSSYTMPPMEDPIYQSPLWPKLLLRVDHDWRQSYDYC
jgi:hypothetical protein